MYLIAIIIFDILILNHNKYKLMTNNSNKITFYSVNNSAYKFTLLLVIFFVSMSNFTFAQKVGFISSQTIREKFNEAILAEQRIQTIVDSWKREIEAMKTDIEFLEEEIKKNRLVWTDAEKMAKQNSLAELKKKRTEFTSKKFEPGGEYDNTVKAVMAPIETKIFAAVQEVSAKEGYDMVLDQSLHPIPYVNFKYDLTVPVLKKLGVNVEELEKDLEKKISNDPRNQEKAPKTIQSKSTSKRKASRTSSGSSKQKETEFEQEENIEKTPETNQEVVPEEKKEEPKPEEIKQEEVKKEEPPKGV